MKRKLLAFVGVTVTLATLTTTAFAGVSILPDNSPSTTTTVAVSTTDTTVQPDGISILPDN